MTVNTNRFSTYTVGSIGSETRNGEQKKDLWSAMLDSVASGKRLPEKNLLVLGGTPESQKDFLDGLSDDPRRGLDWQGAKTPPVANSFALGYTYRDVLDADHEDTLARISIYLLSTPSASFSPLVKPLLTPETIPNTLIIILLDWSQPQLWLRQLREWILMLRDILRSLDTECMDAMESVMVSWRDRGRGGGSTNLDGTGAPGPGDDDAILPLGPGEWEDGLGLPLCVVCQNAGKMEFLEKTQGWKEADFDQILQYLRTILLRHGASLVYTAPNTPSPLQALIHSCLGITSLLKRQPLKHNVIDRDKILVPPNWDSWGKIRVLRDGFDVETVSKGWADDIQKEWPITPAVGGPPDRDSEQIHHPDESSALSYYEEWVPDASIGGLHLNGPEPDASTPEVLSSETQPFLEEQNKILTALRLKLESSKDRSDSFEGRGPRRTDNGDGMPRRNADSFVSDQIGPVQFNMGGIQVDADDMLQRLKDRQEYPDPTTPPPGETVPEIDDNKQLEAFFTGLISRKTQPSVTNSPRSGAT